MRLPIDWLSEFTTVPDNPEILAEQFTHIGLEVEEILRPAENHENLKLVRLVDTAPHPNRDELTICEIDDGQSTFRVVTTAGNLNFNSRYVWAPSGSQLKNQTIEKESLGGVESEGMLCSLAELGLTGSSGSLLELSNEFDPGDDPMDVLHFDCAILDIDLTPNRADCLSILGLARDYGAFLDQKVDVPDHPSPSYDGHATPDVRIDAPDQCPKYRGMRIDRIPNGHSSPAIQRRLIQMGLQPHNPVVDLTNYVLFEEGNPLHAFDLDRLTPDIVVRKAYDEETLMTLDGTELELTSDHLVIADQNKPRALAGIMGGSSSAVTKATQQIFLEGAVFESSSIRRTGQKLKLHTDSSHRFERGVDPRNVKPSLYRFLELLKVESDGSLEIHEPSKAGMNKDEITRVSFIPESYDSLVGYSLEANTIKDTFSRLGLEIEENDGEWSVTIPSWRHDLTRPEDLIEELLRMDGYHNVKSTHPIHSVAQSPTPSLRYSKTARNILARSGFNETVTFSFHSKNGARVSGKESFRQVTNPLSEEHAVLRQSILDSIVPVYQKNYEAGDDNIRLFEIGRVFPEDSEDEPEYLGIIASGNVNAEQWDQHHRTFDFYDLKGIIEQVLRANGHQSVDTIPDGQTGFEPNRCAQVSVEGVGIGHIGQIRSSIFDFNLDTPCWGAELNLSALPQTESISYNSFSKEPFVKRDLDLVVDQSTYARELLKSIREAGKWLERIEIFDLYRGDPLPDDKKSISFRLYFRANTRTLSDKEVNETQETILNELRSNHGASLRDE